MSGRATASKPSLWEWNPDKRGYEPRSDDWWEWDAGVGVLRPREHDGWVWDPAKRAWVDAVGLKAN